MAYVVLPDIIHYACTCGLLKPISKLYFCRHCIQLRCEYCLSHEVDSHFCGKCAENIPSSEARMKKNRCLTCYDCPSCQHQLSIRLATSSQRAATEGNATPRKVYYLACLFCRWTSRDVGIPDQNVACGNWPERENVHANRLTAIQEKYKSVMLMERQEKVDKEKKKHIQRGKYLTLTDKTGLTSAMVRKRVGLQEHSPPVYRGNAKDVTPATAQEEVEVLKPEIFTNNLDLTEIPTLAQRFLQPDWQPETVSLLFPIHKHLSVKRSLRCRTCEHNVSKPEYNPNSIKFKIQLFAYYHVPEVRFVTVEPLRAGARCELIIKVINPTPHQTTVNLLQLCLDEPQEDNSAEEATELPEKKVTKDLLVSSLMQTSITRQASMTVKPRPIEHNVNSNLELHDASIILPPRDDAAEYDDSGSTQNFQDDPKLVVWRKSNKVALRLYVTPSQLLKTGDKVVVGFTLKHIYVNTITTTENKEPQECEHEIKAFMTLGNLVGSD